jgi:hypothetical protein
MLLSSPDVGQGDTRMCTPEVMRAAEDRMNKALQAYSGQKRDDHQSRSLLIDDLRNATLQFLELRGDFYPQEERSEIRARASAPASLYPTP